MLTLRLTYSVLRLSLDRIHALEKSTRTPRVRLVIFKNNFFGNYITENLCEIYTKALQTALFVEKNLGTMPLRSSAKYAVIISLF